MRWNVKILDIFAYLKIVHIFLSTTHSERVAEKNTMEGMERIKLDYSNVLTFHSFYCILFFMQNAYLCATKRK